MDTVRIVSNYRHPASMEWCGAPTIDDQNRIDRSIDVPPEAFDKIEAGICHGYVEGTIFLSGGEKFQWVLDRRPTRGSQSSSRTKPALAIQLTAEVPPPQTAVPASTPPSPAAHRDRIRFTDDSGQPHKVAHPTGDFQQGWVLGEFQKADGSVHAKCPTCGQVVPQPVEG